MDEKERTLLIEELTQKIRELCKEIDELNQKREQALADAEKRLYRICSCSSYTYHFDTDNDK